LAALLLNVVNANNYLSQAGVLEGMDSRRVRDTVSATLYAGAALVAVVDNQVRKGMGRDRFHLWLSGTHTDSVWWGDWWIFSRCGIHRVQTCKYK
jgi:hypothetical protein